MLARAAAGKPRGGAKRRVGAVLAMLLAAILFALPRPSQAGLWSPQTAAAYGLDTELAQLRETRERIVRREALRQSLRRTVRELSREIGVLRDRGERASARIAAEADALRAQERELDRVVPRLLGRLRAIEQRREQAARALADLASLSRRQELHPELRTRMRAIGPSLLALLRSQDVASAALSRRHDRLVQRQQRLAGRLPILRAEVERLRAQREDALLQRRDALGRLAALDAELDSLSRASAALSRRLLTIETAHRARAEPDAAHAAVPAGRSRVAIIADAAVQGRADGAVRAAQASRAGEARAMMAAAVVRLPESRRNRPATTLAARQSLPHALQPLVARHDRGNAARGVVPSPLARLSIAMSAASMPSSEVEPGRLPLPTPIQPSRAMAARLDAQGEQTPITIAALPGQRVAASQDGRVVFADAFKGYGLLLIIEHGSEYHTLLWGFSKLQVAVGDEVRDGEILGVMDVIDGVPPRLGLEFRWRGRPVSPSPWLAGSSSKVRG